MGLCRRDGPKRELVRDTLTSSYAPASTSISEPYRRQISTHELARDSRMSSQTHRAPTQCQPVQAENLNGTETAHTLHLVKLAATIVEKKTRIVITLPASSLRQSLIRLLFAALLPPQPT